MIPRLRPGFPPAPEPAFFDRLRAEGFAGDVDRGAGGRAVYATDNSIYQLEPAALLFPRGVADLAAIARVLSQPAYRHIVLAPRGGGTGTNGQSLTSGVVVDCSRHMNGILHIDPVRRVARVQAGVVKDQLNRALEPYGLFFAPELSTSNRATIGGMVATDACGQGSCLYGKTSNHVLGLRIVLMDGTEWWSRPLDAAALHAVMAREDRIGEIHRTVDSLERDNRERIAEIFPRLNRSLTGYDLAHVRRADGRFDLNAILCGSEGTLALIAEVELNLLPIPKHAALVNICYGDFNTALEDARSLTALGVASIETVDETVLRLARGDMAWTTIAAFFPQAADGINIVEVLADTTDELERKLAGVTAVLDAGATARRGYTVARDPADIGAIWSMRKRAVGLLGNVEGPARPVAFVEDAAVPPENLAAYIREFRALLDGAGLSYGMFGHVDAGVLHVRPALDLTRADHVQLVRRISDAVVDLTRKYGGVLWGEHGKGVRSEYVPAFFGDLYPCLEQIKRAFDPDNRLNPGKIAAPAGEPLLRIDAVPLRGETDRRIGGDVRAAFNNAAYCNGNGACFDFDETAQMCPSYKATGDRRFSPKGRAALMREWLRLLAEQGVDPRAAARQLRKRSATLGFFRRLFNTLDPRNRQDFSHEVRAAMDTCLACKACAGQCPVRVDVPAFRSKFLELYYSRYLRAPKDPLVAAIESTLPLLARCRPLYNLLVGTAPGKALLRMTGLAALPMLPAMSLRREAAALGVEIARPDVIAALEPAERQRVVVFVPDAFTTHFDPQVAVAAMRLARNIGCRPYLAPPAVNGKALHVHGYLGRFEKAAARTARILHQLADLGVPLVGIDPSMTLAYGSEYKGLAGSRPPVRVLLPQEWLATSLARLRGPLRPDGRQFRLIPHCTERSNALSATLLWKDVFDRLDIDVQIVDAGCCGMAGTFGHETRNRAIAERLYEMSWRREIGAADTAELMATGFSCRSQVRAMDRRDVPHPLQVIDALIRDSLGRAGDGAVSPAHGRADRLRS
jgi:FAD/FMN-containing dehydrogenase/Fe-S oxidoreductase